MAKRMQAWQVLVAVILLCGGVIALMRSWRSRSDTVPSWQESFPKTVHTFLYLDVSMLNQAGLLSRFAPGEKAESDYHRFVAESAFDYQRDLRSVLMGFDGQATYVLALGAFDWPALKKYAAVRNGSCRFAICGITGFAGNRAVGYGPFRSDTLAFSSGPDQWAVLALLNREKNPRPAPSLMGPVWLSTTGAALRTTTAVPEGARAYAAVLEAAERVELAFVPQTVSEDLALELRAACREPGCAPRIARDLTMLTSVLTEMLAKEKKSPNPNDLSGVLAGGKFTAEGERVSGKWPLPRLFLERLIASSTP